MPTNNPFRLDRKYLNDDDFSRELSSIPVGTVIDYPVWISSASGEQATDANTIPITLPSGIVVGYLLLVFISVDCNTADLAYVTLSVDTGVSGNNWTLTQFPNGNFNVVGAWAWKYAEGSDALTLNISGITPNQQSTHISHLIQNGFNPTGTGFGSTGGSPAEPPSHTVPSGLSMNRLWFASRHGDNTVVATAAPTDFTNLLTKQATNATGASTNTAQRNFNGPTLDPSSFATTTEQYVTFTIAVDPVASAAIAVLSRYYQNMRRH